MRPKVLAQLRESIAKRNGQLTTGVITTHLALIELSRGGLPADKILCERQAMWAPRVGLPGALDPAGLHRDRRVAHGLARRGCGRTRPAGLAPLLRSRPRRASGSRAARGSHDSIAGHIEASWKKGPEGYELELVVPPNTSASVTLPAAEEAALFEGDQPIQAAAPIVSVSSRKAARRSSRSPPGATTSGSDGEERARPRAARAGELRPRARARAGAVARAAPEPGVTFHVVEARSGAHIVLALHAQDFHTPEAELVRWVERAVAAIEAYSRRLPDEGGARRTCRRATDGAWPSGAPARRAVSMLVGRDATRAALDRDWTLTHELVHLALPSVAERHHWLEEGSATYVEPIARALAGQKSAAAVWGEYMNDYAQGLPEAGDRGLDETPTWGRTYYGGALWCLLADVELRKRTHNRIGLRQALGAVMRAGGSIDQEWPIEQVLAVAEQESGHARLDRALPGPRAHAGGGRPAGAVARAGRGAPKGGQVVFHDDAPLAAIREAITRAE
jgi:hypothetical protein